MAVENKKAIRVYIPNDLAFSILSKLPLKSIKRFTSASKSWSLLFENPNFMKEVRNNFISKLHSIDDDDTCLLLDRLQMPFSNTLYVLSSERFEFEDRVKLEWPAPVREDGNPSYIQILGSSSVNGILCVHQEPTIVLWNPAIGEFKLVPPSLQPYDNIEIYSRPQGFGYDCIRDDYKVIRSARYHENFEGNWVYVPNPNSGFWEWDMPEKNDHFWEQSIVYMYDPYWEIYSLKSNSWRKLDGADMPLPLPSSFEVNSNEVCHWFGVKRNIVSFDFFTNEIFLETTLPTHIPTEKTQSSEMIYTFVHEHLVVLNESVGYIANHDMTAYFHIWILGELGVKESWTKLFVIGPIIGAYFPMRMGKGNVFFNRENVELAWLDLSTQRIEEIDGKGMYRSMIVNYKKNLRPISGMNT